MTTRRIAAVIAAAALALVGAAPAAAAPSEADIARANAVAAAQWPASPCQGGAMRVELVPDGALDQYADTSDRWASTYAGHVGGIYGPTPCTIQITDATDDPNAFCRELAHEWGHSTGEGHPEHGIMSPAEMQSIAYPPCDDAFPKVQPAPAPALVALGDATARAAARDELRSTVAAHGSLTVRCLRAVADVRTCWGRSRTDRGRTPWRAVVVRWSLFTDEQHRPVATGERARKLDTARLPRGTR
jgi:hypothetical protein